MEVNINASANTKEVQKLADLLERIDDISAKLNKRKILSDGTQDNNLIEKHSLENDIKKLNEFKLKVEELYAALSSGLSDTKLMTAYFEKSLDNLFSKIKLITDQTALLKREYQSVSNIKNIGDQLGSGSASSLMNKEYGSISLSPKIDLLQINNSTTLAKLNDIANGLEDIPEAINPNLEKQVEKIDTSNDELAAIEKATLEEVASTNAVFNALSGIGNYNNKVLDNHMTNEDGDTLRDLYNRRLDLIELGSVEDNAEEIDDLTNSIEDLLDLIDETKGHILQAFNTLADVVEEATTEVKEATKATEELAESEEDAATAALLLKEELAEQVPVLDKINDRIEKVMANNGFAAGSMNELKNQAYILREELGNLTIGSEEYIEVAGRLQEVETKIRLQVFLTGSSYRHYKQSFDLLYKTMHLGIQGFNAFNLAIGNTKDSGDDSAKTMVRLQKSMASMMAISEVTKAFQAFRYQLRMLNAMLLTNPWFLLATAVAAVGAAIYTYMQNSDDFSANKKLNDKLQKDIKDFEDLRKTIIGANEVIADYFNLVNKGGDNAVLDSLLKMQEAKDLLSLSSKAIMNSLFGTSINLNPLSLIGYIQTINLLISKGPSSGYNVDSLKELKDYFKALLSGENVLQSYKNSILELIRISTIEAKTIQLQESGYKALQEKYKELDRTIAGYKDQLESLNLILDDDNYATKLLQKIQNSIDELNKFINLLEAASANPFFKSDELIALLLKYGDITADQALILRKSAELQLEVEKLLLNNLKVKLKNTNYLTTQLGILNRAIATEAAERAKVYEAYKKAHREYQVNNFIHELNEAIEKWNDLLNGSMKAYYDFAKITDNRVTQLNTENKRHNEFLLLLKQEALNLKLIGDQLAKNKLIGSAGYSEYYTGDTLNLFELFSNRGKLVFEFTQGMESTTKNISDLMDLYKEIVVEINMTLDALANNPDQNLDYNARIKIYQNILLELDHIWLRILNTIKNANDEIKRNEGYKLIARDLREAAHETDLERRDLRGVKSHGSQTFAGVREIAADEVSRSHELQELFKIDMANIQTRLDTETLTENEIYELKRKYTDLKIGLMNEEVNEANITAKARKKIEEMVVSNISTTAAAGMQIFKENTIAYKAMATMQATIATYSAANQALANGGGVPWGLIPMAATIAAGLANVAAIWSTTETGSSRPSTTAMPKVDDEYVNPTTGLRADLRLLMDHINDQRVYIVASDLDDHSRLVLITNNEITY